MRLCPTQLEKLNNEELCNLYASPNIIKEGEMGGACDAGEGDNICTEFWLENLRARDHFGRPRHRWKKNYNILKETGCENVDWIHLAQDRV
jgi:hypothetical protein